MRIFIYFGLIFAGFLIGLFLGCAFRLSAQKEADADRAIAARIAKEER